MESGPIAPWVGEPLSNAEQRFTTLAAKVGCSSRQQRQQGQEQHRQHVSTQSVHGLEEDEEQEPFDVVACLRSKNSTELQSNKPKCDGLVDWGPVVDGVELSDSPAALAAQVHN